MSAVAPPEAPALPAAFFERVGLTPEREADLETFRRKLARANQTMNLVGASTLADFRGRHFVDSAQLLWFSSATRVWADIGSGAGLPGLVLAILLKGRPGARVHLIESMAKRCRFLAEVAEDLQLPAVIHNARAEDLELEVEMVTARACAPLDRLLGYASPLLEAGARGLFLKGADVAAEVARARETWRFRSEVMTSLSDARGRLLSVEGLGRVRR